MIYEQTLIECKYGSLVIWSTSSEYRPSNDDVVNSIIWLEDKSSSRNKFNER